MTIFITAKHGTGQNLLRAKVTQEVLTLHEAITSLNITTGPRSSAGSADQTISLSSECVMRYNPVAARQECDVRSVLLLWDFDRATISNLTDRAIQEVLLNEVFQDQFGETMPRSAIVGGFVEESGASNGFDVAHAAALKLSYKLYQRTEQQSLGGEKAGADALEAAALETVQAFEGSEVQPHFLSNHYKEKEAARATTRDGLYLAVGIGLLAIYGATVLGRRHAVHSASNLVFASLFCVVLAIAAGFGLCIWVGVTCSAPVVAVAFVVLGLGIDDTFVIMGCYRELDPQLPVPVRVQQALASAGTAIAVTSLTDAAVFALGAINAIPAVADFCIYAMVSILFDFFLQVTAFVGFVVLDARRQTANRYDILCCWRQKLVSQHKLCSNQTFREQESAFVGKLMGKYFSNFVLSPVGMAIALVACIAFTMLGIIGTAQLTVDMDQNALVPADSPIQDTYRVRDQYFSSQAYLVGFFTKQGDYFDHVETLDKLQAAIDNNDLLDPIQTASWWTAFREYSRDGCNVWPQDESGLPAARPDFHSCLGVFLLSSAGAPYRTRVMLARNNDTSIIRSSVIVSVFYPLGDGVRLDAMNNVRATAAAGRALDAVVTSTPFILWEGFAVMWTQTIRNLVIAAVVVFMVSLVFLANLKGAIMVLLMVALVDLQLLGFMYFVGLHIDFITTIFVTLAVGIAVDYSLHVMHAFMLETGTRTERAAAALSKMGVAVLYGATSTFLAVLPLSLSNLYVYQVFFRCCAGIVVLGAFQALVVLPVLLALLGPNSALAQVPTLGESKQTTTTAGLCLSDGVACGKGSQVDSEPNPISRSARSVSGSDPSWVPLILGRS